MGQQLSTGLSESRGGQGPARSSLGGPGWPSHRGGGGPWQSRKPSDFWARERADVAATIAALLPHYSRARLPQARTTKRAGLQQRSEQEAGLRLQPQLEPEQVLTRFH